MADIDKELRDIKNAVYGREVRGAIHDGIEKINKEVEDSTETSEQAKHQVENIQEQVDNLVVSGDSSVEAAQARVDKDNHNYSTLKERLDTEQQQFETQLAQKATKGEIELSDLNKNKVKYDATWFSDEFIQDLAGGNINTTYLEDESITTEKYVDRSITPQKTNFFEKRVEIKPDGLLLNKNVGVDVITEFANMRTVIVPVVENEIIRLEREEFSFTGRVGFLRSYPVDFPQTVVDSRGAGTFPISITVPPGVKYMAWTVSNSSTIPEYGIYREKIYKELTHEPDIFEWSNNLFYNQYEVGVLLAMDGRVRPSHGVVTVILPVGEGEIYEISRDGGTINRLGFINGVVEIDATSVFPVIEPILPTEITVPKGVTHLIWTVGNSEDFTDLSASISIRKKIIKNDLLDIKQVNKETVEAFPKVSKLNTSFGGIIEHEWRSTENHVYTSPKVFVVDGSNTIYSTMDYGQTYKEEIKLDYKPTRQYSNMGHRMLFEPASNNNRNGVVRVYTDDYKLVSEYSGVWSGYNENGADGKPGVDGTWVFGEYVSAPAGGHLGLGVRVMMTRNNGLTWEEKFKLTDVDHIHSCRYDPYNRNHIYINTGDATEDMRNRWYASYDDGETWEHIAGGSLNGGQTPLIDGTFAHDKWMRTTSIAMGVDTGEKGRNSIFYFHDNSPTGFVRYDKTLKKFQIIFDNLEGVAYGTTITEDGMYTITQTSNPDYDILHYVLFPVNDDDIDDPEAYELHTVHLPKRGYKAMTRSSRQIDLAGNSIIGTSINYYSKMGTNLTNNKDGASLGIKVNFGWTNDSEGNKQLIVNTKPLMQKY